VTAYRKAGETDAEPAELIREIILKPRYRYAPPPRGGGGVAPGLRKEVSRKKAAALMRKHGLNARGRRKFIRTTDSRHGLPVCSNSSMRRGLERNGYRISRICVPWAAGCT
jgi:transposase InsO family protein